MHKILLLEDEPDIAESVVQRLSQLGYVVEHVESGDDAIDYLRTLAYDLLILDINVVGSSGIEVLKFEKAQRPESKVLMLTSKAHIEDKLAGFAHGADDYLSKPFDMRELVARIEAMLKRAVSTTPDIIQRKAIRLDVKKRELVINGHPVHLQKQDQLLLEFFLQHPNEVFSTEALLDRVWRYDSNASVAGLRMAISRIRKAAADAGVDPETVIETVARQGYRLSG